MRLKLTPYFSNGKKVTEEENKLFISIFMFVGEGGDSVTEHFYEEENEEMPNYKMLVWLSVLLPYARLVSIFHYIITLMQYAAILKAVKMIFFR